MSVRALCCHVVALLFGLLLASTAAADSQITLSFDDITSPTFNAKAIQATLTGPQMSLLEVRLGEVVVQGKTWRDLRFSCRKFQLASGSIRCDDGVLQLPKPAPERLNPGSALLSPPLPLLPLPVAFNYSSRDQTLELSIKPASGENWRFSARWGGGEAGWESTLTIANGQASRITQLAEFLPDAGKIPAPSKGKITGAIKLRGSAEGVATIETNLAVDGLAFSDASGLHAGENVSGEINAKAIRQGKLWQWQGDLNWRSGEVFWQPLYLTGNGHRFISSGDVDENTIRLLKGNLKLAGIGEAELSGVMERSTNNSNTLRDFDLRATNLALSTLFNQVLKPFLENTAFAEMKTAGRGDIQWRYRNRVSEQITLNLRDASVEDERKRFAFHGINASVPWQAQGATAADISIRSGQVLRMSLGEVRVPLAMNGYNFSIPKLTLPVLDGKLTLEDFNASWQAQRTQQNYGWQWQFSGGLSPVSMQKLTEALQIQPMHGTLSGVIPKVSYAGSTLKVDGALLFKVFDGTVVAKNLTLLEPLGLAPRLTADLDMQNLDLDLLTRTFSFGNMQGRIDVAVNGLELANWKPVKFDASLMSSPGDYPRRISQAAVQNISSLGGAGAAAAIQRSFLRFFEQFGYSKIGWSCELRNEVCRMGGVESAPQGYIIVKGGGIPAITVMGYNRNVNWRELVDRLQRITQGNVKPIIQ